MEYRVEDLASAAGVSVDTVRFYQGRGLLPAPERRGRRAIYGPRHLERLREIRRRLDEGFTLAQIRSLAERAALRPGEGPEPGEGDEASHLLAALVRETRGERRYTAAELAAGSGMPEPLIAAARSAGLLSPIEVEGEERFTDADLEMLRAGLSLLSAGLPLQELLALAVDHAGRIEEVTDRAIELFDRYVRKQGGAAGDDAAVAAAFRELLPQVTRLVALHFQRTLVNRALARLHERGDEPGLEAALAATESARLEVLWR